MGDLRADGTGGASVVPGGGAGNGTVGVPGGACGTGTGGSTVAADCRTEPAITATWSSNTNVPTGTDSSASIADLWADAHDAFAVVTILDSTVFGGVRPVVVRRTADGKWLPEAMPGLPATDAGVRDIWGTSANDLWAVSFTKVFHRTGDGWSEVIVPVPSPNSVFAAINGRDSTSFWIVGDNGLVMKSNGSTWDILPPPTDPLRSVTLTAVYGAADDDVWVGGGLAGSGRTDMVLKHWDGYVWSDAFSSPPAGSVGGLAGFASNDIWAVGSFDGAILHFDGSSWTASPVPSAVPVGLFSISAACPNDIWTVGYTAPTSSANDFQPLVLHWNGSTWAPIAAPVAVSPSARLYQLTAVAVGGPSVFTGGGQMPAIFERPR